MIVVSFLLLTGLIVQNVQAKGGLRFLEGKSPREGVVQVYYNKTWGWVGSDQWDKRDAEVACRMMDFDGSISVEFHYENRTGINATLWLNNLQCTGNESSLFACTHDGLGCDSCEGKRIAGAVCKSKVRLVGGEKVESQGRVEVFHSGTWGTVCDYNWNILDANVVCRQLGFPSALIATKGAAFGRGQGMIWMTNVQCTGRESSLTECSHGVWGRTNYCYHGGDAGVTCSTARFLEGKSPREGLVQVYYKNTLAWVCADQWDKQEADVACRMLDFDGSISAEFDNEKRTGITTTVWLNNLQCTGNESSLFTCVHDGLGCDGCEGKRIAGVVCKLKVRLSTRDSIESKGLVEVFHNGIWRTVCADGWDLKDADVVCRELGFTGALNLFVSSRFPAIGTRSLYGVKCVGNETSLMECYHNIRWSSYCSSVAGVVCTTARLVGGRSPTEGLVQVYHNKTWGWVCADKWDKQDADVACRMVDFDKSLSVGFEHEKSTGIKAPAWLDNMECTGNESNLFSCVHDRLVSNDCRETRKAGVKCTPRVRLVGWGNVSSQGRVEVFYNGMWGPVSGYNWDLKNAGVVCRQLGFKGAFGAGMDAERNNARYLHNVRCVGNEISITECDHSWWRSRHYFYFLLPVSAVVVCITDPRHDLYSNPQTTTAAFKTRASEIIGNRASVSPLLPAVIVLGVLFSFATISVCFMLWTQGRHLQSKGEDADVEKRQHTQKRGVGMSTCVTARESEHTYFEPRPRAPQDQVTTELHYQELQKHRDFTEYKTDMKKEKQQQDYSDVENTTYGIYEEVLPRIARRTGR